jgi:hypothetical protein
MVHRKLSERFPGTRFPNTPRLDYSAFEFSPKIA